MRRLVEVCVVYLEVALVGVVVGLVLLHEGLEEPLVEVVAVDAVEQRPQHPVTELNTHQHDHTQSFRPSPCDALVLCNTHCPAAKSDMF
jgi:hypothetical protein